MVPGCVVEPRRGVVQLRYGCLRNRVGVLDYVEVSLCLVRLPVMVGPPQLQHYIYVLEVEHWTVKG